MNVFQEMLSEAFRERGIGGMGLTSMDEVKPVVARVTRTYIHALSLLSERDRAIVLRGESKLASAE